MGRGRARRGLSAAVAAALMLAAPLHAQQGAIVLDDAELAQGLGGLDGAEPRAEAAAQPDAATLADMQASLRAVAADLQALRAELLASGAQGFAAAGGDSAIDRMNAMEAQIAALTDRTEQLANRIRQVVAHGSNRVGDLEFRLCEMDPNCDLGSLMTAELGGSGNASLPGLPNLTGSSPAPAAEGGVSASTLPPISAPPTGATPPTEEEAREYAEARQAIAAQDWPLAITRLTHLTEAHAGGPLTADALHLLGLAQQGQGKDRAAASSYLMAFSAAPDGPSAPASLLALARLMPALGAAQDACLYLDELTRRFPGTTEAAEAPALSKAASCGTVADSDG